ncbi:MAG TPA: hypothetical protein VL156_02510 [Terriglobales bacterium]|jgi:hypothetical protein|nr:hypothetical protein [Terriglobales bacterium]
MTQFQQRGRPVWGSAQAQDIAEYAAMLAIILLLVIGTLKLISKHRRASSATPTPPSLTR